MNTTMNHVKSSKPKHIELEVYLRAIADYGEYIDITEAE